MLRHCVFGVSAVVIALTVGCAHNERGESNAEPGFRPLFNGKDLSGWMYPKNAEGKEIKQGAGNQVRADDGVPYCTATDGGRLMTTEQYDDFVLRFEFKLTPNANNGIAIRSAPDGNPAYRGMEIQILDDSGSKYHAPNKEIRPAQYHGSIYDIVPAKQGHQKPVGEWNQQEIVAVGSRIKVILNGATIVDADLAEIKDEHVLAKHPGVKNKK